MTIPSGGCAPESNGVNQKNNARIFGGVRGRSRFIVALFRDPVGSNNEGGSLVEFALVLPMMMMLILGMFSFGIAFNNYIVLTDAVGAGARTLSVVRGQTTPAMAASDPCAYAVQITKNAAPVLKTSAMTFNIVWTTTNSSGAAVSTPYTNTCPGLIVNAGDTVQVGASYPALIIMYGWKSGSFNLTAQTAELVQ